MDLKTAGELIGQRGLFRVHAPGMDDSVAEGKIVEIAPSGQYVRMGGSEGGWVQLDKLTLLEKLPDAKAAKVKEPAIVALPPAKQPEAPKQKTEGGEPQANN